MIARDDETRARLAAGGVLFDGYHPEMEAVHRANAARLRELVAVHGWPGRALVGAAAASAAWRIVQHAIGEPELMRAMLPVLEAAAVAGDVASAEVAMLDDRIRVLEGRPQRYGTQYDWNDAFDAMVPSGEVEDPEAVDVRRAAVGLPPIEWRRPPPPDEPPPADPAARRAAYEAWLRVTGWRSCATLRSPTDPDADGDVPIRVDFRDPATARTWVEETRIRRPYRPRFFAAFCAALTGRPGLRILELGSGPGQLARELLIRCDVRRYVALDFSPAMHALAAEHLGPLASRVDFVTRDFREPPWPDGLGRFDAVVTLQAAHETRHKRHLVPLLARARLVLVPCGVVLYADHYLTRETKLPALAPAREDQPLALAQAGFVDVELLHDEGNMALWRGTRPPV